MVGEGDSVSCSELGCKFLSALWPLHVLPTGMLRGKWGTAKGNKWKRKQRSGTRRIFATAVKPPPLRSSSGRDLSIRSTTGELNHKSRIQNNYRPYVSLLTSADCVSSSCLLLVSIIGVLRGPNDRAEDKRNRVFVEETQGGRMAGGFFESATKNRKVDHDECAIVAVAFRTPDEREGFEFSAIARPQPHHHPPTLPLSDRISGKQPWQQ